MTCTGAVARVSHGDYDGRVRSVACCDDSIEPSPPEDPDIPSQYFPVVGGPASGGFGTSGFSGVGGSGLSPKDQTGPLGGRGTGLPDIPPPPPPPGGPSYGVAGDIPGIPQPPPPPSDPWSAPIGNGGVSAF